MRAILKAMKEKLVTTVHVLNCYSKQTKEKFTNYFSLLKKLFPKLPYTELYHPTWFTLAKLPWQVQWDIETDAAINIQFDFCARRR